MLSNKVIFMLMLILILPIYLSTEPLIRLWLGTVGQYMVEFTRLSLVYTFILCLSNPITTIVQAGIVDTFTLLSLPVVYLLFKRGVSPTYAYMTTIIVFGIAHIIRLIVLRRTIVFSVKNYFQKFIIPSGFALVLSSIFVCPLSHIKWNNIFCEIIANTIIAVIVAVLICSLCVLNNEERRMIFGLLKNKIQK